MTQLPPPEDASTAPRPPAPPVPPPILKPRADVPSQGEDEHLPAGETLAGTEPSAPPTQPDPIVTGWRRRSPNYESWQRALLIGFAVACVFVWGAVFFGFLGVGPLRVIAAIMVFVGAGFRLYAHGEKVQNLVFLDLCGKAMAYYGAFTVLLTL